MFVLHNKTMKIKISFIISILFAIYFTSCNNSTSQKQGISIDLDKNVQKTIKYSSFIFTYDKDKEEGQLDKRTAPGQFQTSYSEHKLENIHYSLSFNALFNLIRRA